jgi:hypothetical protein
METRSSFFAGRLIATSLGQLTKATSASPYPTHLRRAYVRLEVAKALGLLLSIDIQLLDFAQR